MPNTRARQNSLRTPPPEVLPPLPQEADEKAVLSRLLSLAEELHPRAGMYGPTQKTSSFLSPFPHRFPAGPGTVILSKNLSSSRRLKTIP